MSFRVLLGRAGSAAAAASPLRHGKCEIKMPLKAKILDRRVTTMAPSEAQLSTEQDPLEKKPKRTKRQRGVVEQVIKEKPGDPPEDVLFNNTYGLRTVELNRPDKLNALDASMIRKIIPRLVEWERSDMANVVVMKGAGDKALCAGGDVKTLALSNREGPEGQTRSSKYFALEYKLDHYIANYQKPYIAFMDGFTMGGGVGLSIHAPFRIATERTVFAMPETTIGFFPDVGASFFLPRMNGSVGKYLALTSARVTGANVFYSGIATHYLHSATLPMLESRLGELRFRDGDDMESRLAIIDMTIEEYATGLPPLEHEPMTLAGELRKAIDRCFSKADVPSIMAALAEEAALSAEAALSKEVREAEEQQPIKKWARETLATLRQRSPTSVLVAFKQLEIGKTWSISETFKKEHAIASQFMRHPDFSEGVLAQLSREKPKPKPQWQPATLEDIPDANAITEPFFANDAATPLRLLVNDDYNEYPFAKFGVPNETAVRKLVEQGTRSKRQVAKEFVRRKKGKQGINLIVKEILNRKTVQDEKGIAVWVDEP